MKRQSTVSRRNFLRLTALAAGGSLVAACTQAATPAPSTGGQATQAPAQQAAAGSKTVVLWGVGVDLESRLAKNPKDSAALWEKWLVDNFQAQNPDAKVKGEDHGWDEPLRTGLLTSIAGNTAPDATIGEAFVHEFAALGAFNEVQAIKPDDFVPGSVRGALIEGKLYGVPAFTSSFALEINRTILEKSGIDKNKVPGSWNELLEMSTTIFEKGNKGKDWFGFTVYGPTPVRTYGSALRAMPWVNRTGALMGPDDGSKATFNDPKGVAAYEYLRSLFKTTDKGTSLSEDEQKVGGAVWDNKACFQVSAVWDCQSARDRKADTVFVPIPVCSDSACKAANVVLGNLTWSPLKKGKAAELGVKWCEFVGQAETQKQIGAIRGGVMPARKSVLQDTNLTKQSPYEGYNAGAAVQQKVLLDEDTHPTPPFSKNASKIWNMWSDVFGKVLLTDTPVKTLLDDMQAQAEKLLAG
jgi:ABC-type glycerol-3-phosphate transport system substrate-binding protein